MALSYLDILSLLAIPGSEQAGHIRMSVSKCQCLGPYGREPAPGGTASIQSHHAAVRWILVLWLACHYMVGLWSKLLLTPGSLALGTMLMALMHHSGSLFLCITQLTNCFAGIKHPRHIICSQHGLVPHNWAMNILGAVTRMAKSLLAHLHGVISVAPAGKLTPALASGFGSHLAMRTFQGFEGHAFGTKSYFSGSRLTIVWFLKSYHIMLK